MSSNASMKKSQLSKSVQLFKVIIVGDSGVGKTNILLRYINNKFILTQNTTIGFQFYVKDLEIQNQHIKMQIWDTAGQDRYRSMTHVFYKNAIGALVVFDLGSRISFQGTIKWIKQIKDHAMQQIVEYKIIQVMVLIGNKSDLVQRQIQTQQALKFAKNEGMAYFQTSAKQNINVNECFQKLSNQIFNKYKQLERVNKKNKTKNQKQNQNGNGNQNSDQKDNYKPLVLSSTKKKKDNENNQSPCCKN